MDNFKQLYDLMVVNSATPRADLANGGFDAGAEFANGEALFYVNGNWEWSNLEGKGMSADQLHMYPYYCGVAGEEKVGLNAGTENYWAVNAEASEADIQATLPELDFIAEDLGYVTAEVRALQEGSGYPGMKVMQFAFDSREEGNYLPHTYPENSVCYSGTHDNLTMAQWFQEAAPMDISMAKAYLGLNEEEGLVKGMIRGCMGSVSKLCIVQMQDYLELDSEARMNFPGTLSSCNWTWRAVPGVITDALADRLLELPRRYGRI